MKTGEIMTDRAQIVAAVLALAQDPDRRFSASKIAAMVGSGLTRNAVIGICWRRGVHLRGRSGRFRVGAGRPREQIPSTDEALAELEGL